MPAQSSNLNDNFFSGSYKEVWRKLVPHGISEAECTFIEDAARLKTGDAVLDLMCGYGRHALPLARKGYRVTAVDNSADYVAEVKAAAAAESLPVEAVTAGVMDMELTGRYQGVICMGNSFAFFDRTDAVKLLQKVAAHLQPEGMLLINSWMVAEIAIKYFQEKEWMTVDGYKYLLDYTFHFQPSRIQSEHTLIAADGRIEVLKGVDYIFTLAEMETMFNEAGLTTTGLYGMPRKQRPFRMGDNRIYITAGKAAPSF